VIVLTNGMYAARNVLKNKKRNRWNDRVYKNRILNLKEKSDSLEGAPQARGSF